MKYEVEEIDGRIMMLTQQRDSLANQVVLLGGRLTAALAEVSALKEKYEGTIEEEGSE